MMCTVTENQHEEVIVYLNILLKNHFDLGVIGEKQSAAPKI